jgi:hypothetical protein
MSGPLNNPHFLLCYVFIVGGAIGVIFKIGFNCILQKKKFYRDVT